jgi:hypothetical protein
MTQPLALASWEDMSTRQAILDFVGKVTDPDGEGFVPPAERIATFDNDSTLWCEKPVAQDRESHASGPLRTATLVCHRMHCLLPGLAADRCVPCLLVSHDDAKREVEYGAEAEKAVKDAGTDGWTVISMENDWKQVFAFQYFAFQ